MLGWAFSWAEGFPLADAVIAKVVSTWVAILGGRTKIGWAKTVEDPDAWDDVPRPIWTTEVLLARSETRVVRANNSEREARSEGVWSRRITKTPQMDRQNQIRCRSRSRYPMSNLPSPV